jgi:putative ABC transport system permease protein
MSVLGEFGRRVWFLINRRRFETTLQREMQSHRAMMEEPRRFGNVLRLREESRDVWGWQWLDDLVRDLRYAGRELMRAPGFSLVAVFSLALATGATTAIFSVVNGVILRPLPFGHPDRLVQMFGRSWGRDEGPVPDPLTGPVGRELEAYRQQSKLLESMAGFDQTTVHLAGPAGAERLMAVRADLTFFSVLDVPAQLGRAFRTDDGPDVAVIGAGLWERLFQRDPGIAGKSITLDGRTFTIVGVMPEHFQFPYRAGSRMSGTPSEARTDVWLPLPLVRTSPGGPLWRGRVSVVARLKPEVRIEAALAELRSIAADVQRQLPDPLARVGVRLEPLDSVVVGRVQGSLWMLFAAVGLVLAATCANVANLLLSRMTSRIREVVTRAALGASRQRLARQLLTESLLLSLLGGIAGVLVARWSTKLLTDIAAARIPRAHEVALDWQAFTFLLLICIGTAVVFGLVPAFAATRIDVHSIAREAAGHATVGRRYGRLRDVLVVVEVTLAFVLAVGAATVFRELIRLQRVDNGMTVENVLTLHMTPRASAQDYGAIEQRVAALPGVVSAGLTQFVPLQNWGWSAGFEIKGRTSQTRLTASLRYVTPGYFRTLGIRMLKGRGFTERDDAKAPMVVVINEALAKRYMPGQDPIDVVLDRGVIVGVIADVLQVGLDQPSEPEIYYAAAQNVTMSPDIGMSLAVRTAIPPERAAESIRAAIREINPNLAVFNVRTMTQVVSDSLWELRLYRWLIGIFAALTLLLAAIGLHGVMAYNVTSRMREFAVRLALGSDPGDLTRLVVGRALLLVGAGVVAGVVTAMVITPMVRALPIGSLTGPTTYAVVGAVLITIALLACLVPALRVARVDPASALRHE